MRTPLSQITAPLVLMCAMIPLSAQTACVEISEPRAGTHRPFAVTVTKRCSADVVRVQLRINDRSGAHLRDVIEDYSNLLATQDLDPSAFTMNPGGKWDVQFAVQGYTRPEFEVLLHSAILADGSSFGDRDAIAEAKRGWKGRRDAANTCLTVLQSEPLDPASREGVRSSAPQSTKVSRMKEKLQSEARRALANRGVVEGVGPLRVRTEDRDWVFSYRGAIETCGKLLEQAHSSGSAGSMNAITRFHSSIADLLTRLTDAKE